MLHARNLSFGFEKECLVLSSIDLDVPRGAIALVAGMNGSGKSTLLALLAGLLSPVSGRIEAGGSVSPGEEAGVRRVCRLVMQDPDVQILGATAVDDLMLGRDAAFKDRAFDMGRRFGLADHLQKPVQTLSFGMRRKLCLAAALLDEPQALLLDEPFSGLDYPSALEMRRILRRGKAENLTQFVAVHDLEPVADLADLFFVLHEGRLALAGTPAEVLPHVGRFGVRPPCSWLESGAIRPWSLDDA